MTRQRTTDKDLLAQRWYVVPDTLIGGWSVANVDKDTASHNHDAGEWSVADFVHETVARHIVELHDRALDLDRESMNDDRWPSATSADEVEMLDRLESAYLAMKGWLYRGPCVAAMDDTPRARAAEALWESIGEFCWPDHLSEEA